MTETESPQPARPQYETVVYQTAWVIDFDTGQVLTGDDIPQAIRDRWDRALRKAFAQSA